MVRYRAGKSSLIASAVAVAFVWLSGPRSAADDAPAARSGAGVEPSRETKANAATQASAAPIDVHAALLHGHREGAKWVASAGADRIRTPPSSASVVYTRAAVR